MLFNLYINDVFRQIKDSGAELVAGYADDLVFITDSAWQLEKAIQALKSFCQARKLRLNPSKSEVVPFNKRKTWKEFQGIKIVKSAKYLGVVYDNRLSVKYTLSTFVPKVNYIRYRLRNLRSSSDPRTNYNLWAVFIAPLIRMAVSVIGETNSMRARKGFEEIRTASRKHLKSFLMCPSFAPSFIFDELTGASDEHLFEIMRANDAKCTTRRELGAWYGEDPNFINDFDEDPSYEPRDKIRSFHPEFRAALAVINRY